MKIRTKIFARRVINLCKMIPDTRECRIIANQLLRSATSVGANYRAACRARSKADFKSKLGIALEETDESLYWMELIADSKILSGKELRDLMAEANELISIFVASLNTLNLKKNLKSHI